MATLGVFFKFLLTNPTVADEPELAALLKKHKKQINSVYHYRLGEFEKSYPLLVAYHFQNQWLVAWLVQHGATLDEVEATSLLQYVLNKPMLNDFFVLEVVKMKPNCNLLHAKDNVQLFYRLCGRILSYYTYEIVSTALRDGADAFMFKAIDKTFPLWHACERGNYPAVKALLEDAAADPVKKQRMLAQRRDMSTNSCPLYVAVQNNEKEIAVLLIRFGFDVNSSAVFSTQTCSCLDIACERGHFDLTCILLAAGADLDGEPMELLPEHRARSNFHHQVADVIISYRRIKTYFQKEKDNEIDLLFCQVQTNEIKMTPHLWYHLLDQSKATFERMLLNALASFETHPTLFLGLLPNDILHMNETLFSREFENALLRQWKVVLSNPLDFKRLCSVNPSFVRKIYRFYMRAMKSNVAKNEFSVRLMDSTTKNHYERRKHEFFLAALEKKENVFTGYDEMFEPDCLKLMTAWVNMTIPADKTHYFSSPSFCRLAEDLKLSNRHINHLLPQVWTRYFFESMLCYSGNIPSHMRALFNSPDNVFCSMFAPRHMFLKRFEEELVQNRSKFMMIALADQSFVQSASKIVLYLTSQAKELFFDMLFDLMKYNMRYKGERVASWVHFFLTESVAFQDYFIGWMHAWSGAFPSDFNMVLSGTFQLFFYQHHLSPKVAIALEDFLFKVLVTYLLEPEESLPGELIPFFNWRSYSTRLYAKITSWFKRQIDNERAVFAAFFDHTADDETSEVTEIEGSSEVPSLLAETLVSPHVNVRHRLRLLHSVMRCTTGWTDFFILVQSCRYL